MEAADAFESVRDAIMMVLSGSWRARLVSGMVAKARGTPGDEDGSIGFRHTVEEIEEC